MISGAGGLYRTPLQQIPKRLEIYEELLKAAESLFELEGKLLVDACKAHLSNLALYDTMYQECRTIELFLESKREEIEATLYKQYVETSQRQLSAKDLTMYIRGDPQVIEVIQVLLEVSHVKRQLEAVVEAFKTMGWSLSNITKLKVAQIEDTIL